MKTTRSMGIRIAAALITVSLAGVAQASTYASFEEASQAAAQEGKPILVDFYTTWCGPCKAFTRAVEGDADVQAALDRVVLYKTDAEKEGLEFAKQNEVHLYPTFVLMSAKGEPIDRWSGYGKSQFLETMNGAFSDLTTLKEKRKRFRKEPTVADALALARTASSLRQNARAVSFYRSAARLDPQNDYTLEIFDEVFYGLRSDDGYLTADALEAADAVLASPDADGSDDLHVAQMLSYLPEAKDGDFLRPYLEVAIERSEKSEDPEVASMRAELLPQYALYVKKDEKKAVEYKKAAMPEGWKDDASQLNAFAWWCFENKVDLKEAKRMADRGVELAAAGREKAMVLDTAAEICNALANCREAVDLARRAIAEDPENDYYQGQLERFETRLAQQK